jgi:Na+/melibiose symporter-like transporter
MKRKALIGWAIGSFSSSVLIGAVGLLHLRFMTDSLGLAIALAGMLVVVSRIYDAVLDPVMGVLSDRTRTPWGRYRPYLLGGSLLSALSLVVMFNVPRSLSGIGLIAYVTFSLLLFSTAYTMWRIPYLALGRTITQDFNERSKLITFSVYGSSLGGFAATSAAPFLLAKMGSDRAGHGVIAMLLAVLIAIAGIVCFLLLDSEVAEIDADGAAIVSRPISFGEAGRVLRENRPFQSLIGFKVMMFTALAIHGTALPYYTRHVLKASDVSLSSIFLAQMIASAGSQFVWVRAARRFGRRNALLTAGLMQICAFGGWILLPVGHPAPWMQILSAFQGMAGGGIFFGLYTVLTDTMDYARNHGDGGAREGILAGVFVMVEKGTTALGTFIFSSILAYVGYVSAQNAGSYAQPHGVLLGITLAVSVLPAAAALIGCLFLGMLHLPAGPGREQAETPRLKKTYSPSTSSG